MNQAASLQQLLANARKRCVSHLALDAILLALAIGFGTAAVVLIAGTEFLGFYWIVIGLAAGLGIGYTLLRRRTPAEYLVAQQMDQRLRLADTLSTAAYFASPAAPAQTDPVIREAQLARAEQVAQTVDLRAALPMARPSSLYPATALALVALGVFLFRFAVTGSFDPRASLIKNALNSLMSPSGEKTKLPGQQGKDGKQGDGETDQQDAADKDKNDFAGDPSSEPNPNSADEQNQAKNDANKDDQSQDKQDGQNSPDSESKQGAPVAQDDQKNQGNPQNGNQSGQQNQDESMFDKMKQAISDLMNKMKPQSGEGKGKSNQKSESAQAKAEESKDDNQSDNSQDSNEDQNGADTQETANNAANQSSKEQQNGAGNNEGDKAQRQAEALKAMGKLSELMGKRAENITGAVMVEVGSTKQQMKTPVAQRAATHSEAGSEIHRDEVPPMYQQFVQQYFDQVRKSAPASNKPAPAAATAKQP